MIPYDRESAIALRAVRQAAGLCREVQRELAAGAITKGDKSPVTVADFGSQALVCRLLASEFPQDPVIAEEDSATLRLPEHAGVLDEVERRVRARAPEASREQVCGWIDRGRARDFSRRFWTLDPIDGTKGFLRGEQYAVALALIVDGAIEVGALACPNLDEGMVALAVRGQGSRRAALEGEDGLAPLSVSSRQDVSSARFCESVESGHSAQGASAQAARLLGITAEPVRLDSQAKYAVVASGQAEIYMRLPTRADYREKIWDHAAGAIVVAEAGGVVTDALGKPLDFTRGSELAANSGVVAASCAAIHERLIEALRAAGVS